MASERWRTVVLAIALAVALAGGACSGGSDAGFEERAASQTRPTSSTTSPTTQSAVPLTTAVTFGFGECTSTEPEVASVDPACADEPGGSATTEAEATSGPAGPIEAFCDRVDDMVEYLDESGIPAEDYLPFGDLSGDGLELLGTAEADDAFRIMACISRLDEARR